MYLTNFFVDTTKPKGYWKDINNQRAFFDEFAKEEGFDPLVVENWYAIEKPRILQKKVVHLYPSAIMSSRYATNVGW